AWSVLAFAAKPNEAKPVTAMPVDIISATELSQMTAGARNAAKVETPKPLVENVAERKPPDDPTAKVAAKEIKAATDVPPVPAVGAPSEIGAQLSQSELDALRARLAQLWNPPAGASNPEELVVLLRIKLRPDGRLADGPMVLSRGQSALYVAARDSAVRAVFRGQPFDMLRPEHYEQWKDIEITFDPRDMIRG